MQRDLVAITEGAKYSLRLTFVTETHQQTCPGRPQKTTGPDANAIIYLLIKHNLCNIWSQEDFGGGGGAVSKSASEFTYVYTRIHKPEPQTRRVTYGRAVLTWTDPPFLLGFSCNTDLSQHRRHKCNAKRGKVTSGRAWKTNKHTANWPALSRCPGLQTGGQAAFGACEAARGRLCVCCMLQLLSLRLNGRKAEAQRAAGLCVQVINSRYFNLKHISRV